jgi:hypothetical protein
MQGLWNSSAKAYPTFACLSVYNHTSLWHNKS